MNTMLVWILISVSTPSTTRGDVNIVGHFKTQQMCEHVRKNIPAQYYFQARCIQAEIVK